VGQEQFDIVETRGLETGVDGAGKIGFTRIVLITLGLELEDLQKSFDAFVPGALTR